MFRWFNNLGIRVKLLLSFAAVIAFMGIAVFFGIRAVQSANTATGDVYNNQMKVFADVANVDGFVADSTIASKSALLASDKTQADQFATDSQASLDKAIAGLAAVEDAPEGARACNADTSKEETAGLPAPGKAGGAVKSPKITNKPNFFE